MEAVLTQIDQVQGILEHYIDPPTEVTQLGEGLVVGMLVVVGTMHMDPMEVTKAVVAPTLLGLIMNIQGVTADLVVDTPVGDTNLMGATRLNLPRVIQVGVGVVLVLAGTPAREADLILGTQAEVDLAVIILIREIPIQVGPVEDTPMEDVLNMNTITQEAIHIPPDPVEDILVAGVLTENIITQEVVLIPIDQAEGILAEVVPTVNIPVLEVDLTVVIPVVALTITV